MRIILSGSGSFIALAVVEACRSSTIEYLTFRHDQDITGIIEAGDCLINFAIDPRYRNGDYHENCDRDLTVARLAARAGAHFVMLSTRRVYPAKSRWNAMESVASTGDETFYGRNKAISEKAVQEACDGKAGIFRLSNVFGYEYSFPSPRRSFLGQLLFALKQHDKIFFDMHPATRRDFLPIEICASFLVARAIDSTAGIYNLGTGLAIPCGDFAGWIMDGFGSGELVCNPMVVRDEFFLNVDKWRSQFGLSIDNATIRNYGIMLGRRLQCEKY
jgi:UDP-glucose 4-epimerase